MGDDKKIRNGAVWGLCFIASAIFFLTEPTISNLFENFMVRFLLLEFAIGLFIFSFVEHIRGFVFLGRKLGIPSLEKSAQAMAITLAFFGSSIMTSVLFGADHDYELRTYANYFVIFFALPSAIAALSFGIAVTRHRRDLGTMAVCSAPLGLSILFMWQPWPAIFLVLPSIFLLFRASVSNRYTNTPIN